MVTMCSGKPLPASHVEDAMKRSTIAIIALLTGPSVAAPALAGGGFAGAVSVGSHGGGFRGGMGTVGVPPLGAGVGVPPLGAGGAISRPGRLNRSVGGISTGIRLRGGVAITETGSRHHPRSGHWHHDGKGNWRNVGPDWGGYAYGGDGDGYADTIPMSQDNGYFNSGGEVYAREGERPIYDYDRGYPYEWYKPAAARSPAMARRSGEQHISCTIEGASVRVCRGE